MLLRVRFAPSPTGYLHIGSARTFLFNWLYARGRGGTMILRLDDTDLERNTQEAVDSIFDGLRWLELDWDEYYRQSERVGMHQRAAEALLAKGAAYRDFTAGGEERSYEDGPWRANEGMREMSTADSERRAAAGDPFVVRFRAPRGAGRVVRFVDEVYGDQARDGDEIEDFALLRSTGMPTYHMASCADDADLRISHVVRGQDHLSNTFKHVLLFEAMGVEAPRFAHLPLLLAPDGSKLSKRKHGPAVSVTTYRDAGFLPQAYVNFLCLLGWSPKDNREQMTRGEIVEAFTLEGVKRSNAVVNFTEEDPVDPKALWLNGHHLREMPVGELLPYVRRELAGAGLAAPEEEERFAEVVEVIRTRYGTLRDFVTRGRAYFVEDFTVDPELLAPGTRELLRELGERLEAEGEFSEAAIEKELRGLAAERGVGAGVLLRGARAVLTGQSVGPGAFAVFTILGRKRAIARLRAA